MAELLVRIDATTETLRRELKRGDQAVADSARVIDLQAARMNRAFQSTAQSASINRQGLMSLQASGVNAFQALAAGMDPFRVAMMEGAQVLGALVQGGILTFSNALGLLRGPLGIVAGAVTAAAGAYFLLGGNTRDAAKAQEDYVNALKAANDLTDAAAEKSRIAAEAKKKEAEQNLINALNIQRENLANLERDRQAAGLAQRALEERAGKTIGGQESLRDNFSLIQKIDDRINGLRADIAAAEAALKRLDNPAPDSELGKGLGLDDAAKAARKADEESFKDFVDNLVKTGEAREKARQAIDDQAEGLRREAAAVQESDRARFIANETLKAERVLRQSQLDSKEIEQRIDLVKQEAAANYDANEAAKARNKATEEAKRADKQRADELGRVFEGSFDRVGAAITEMSLQGENAFASLANVGKAVASEITQDFIKLAAINPLKNALFGDHSPTLSDASGLVGQLFGGLFGSGIASYGYSGNTGAGGNGSLTFGGPRAGGGSVSASTPYIVGERGPELFIPHTSGGIVSNDNLGRMGGGPVFQIDARGASVEAVARLEKLVRSINGSIEGRAVAAVSDFSRRGR